MDINPPIKKSNRRKIKLQELNNNLPNTSTVVTLPAIHLKTMEILSTSITGALAGAFVGYVSERLSNLVGFGNLSSMVVTDPSRSSQVDSILGLLLQTFLIGAGTQYISVIMPSFTRIPVAMVIYSLALQASAPTESRRIVSLIDMLSISSSVASTPATN